METRKVIYKETQLFWISIIPAILILTFTIFAYLYKFGTRPIPLFATLIIIFFFLTIILLTYKMTITIDDKYINITFGIGIIRKKIELSEINHQEIKKATIPWYYGVGIKFGNDVSIYNTRSGSGIELTSYSRKYLISTKNYQQIKNIITIKTKT